MLHPIFALKSNGYRAEYDDRLATIALKEFLATLPDGEESYYQSVRLATWSLYAKSLALSGARYFLDKTPRYYLILPELCRVFPHARILLLIRNPLAVLVSILRTWMANKLDSQIDHLRKFRHDLLDAPKLLADGVQSLNGRAVVVHYEHLVRSPNQAVTPVCQSLGLEFLPTMIEYGQGETPKWRFGDQGKVYDNRRPVAKNGHAWQQALANPQIWRLVHDYLQRIGPETLSQLGYDVLELNQILENHAPTGEQLSKVKSLNDALGDTSKPRRLSFFERLPRFLRFRFAPSGKQEPPVRNAA
jgi:hypothetical protein